MFLFLIRLIILLINISPSLFDEYLCPVDAYGWTLYDNKTKQIYRWIYDEKTEEFKENFSLIKIVEKYQIFCFDINQQMYQTININKNDFQIQWICDYEMNEGEIQIKSWIFNEIFSPKNIYLQIKNYYQIEIPQTKIIRISLNIIQQIFNNLSTMKNLESIFYELILDYGEKYGLITVQLRPLFEEYFYILSLDLNHNNNSYIDFNCSSMYAFHNTQFYWFNFTSLLSRFNSKLSLQYSQLISSQLSCINKNCFTRILTHFYPKYI